MNPRLTGKLIVSLGWQVLELVCVLIWEILHLIGLYFTIKFNLWHARNAFRKTLKKQGLSDEEVKRLEKAAFPELNMATIFIKILEASREINWIKTM